MISFVWSAKYPFLAAAGGSENYTAGQIRELMRRGIPTRILTLGHGENDGRDSFPDITFKALSSKKELSKLDDTLVFVTYPLDVPTKRQSYAILHCPPMSCGTIDPLFDRQGVKGKKLIAPSRYFASAWAKDLKVPQRSITTVYPFAEEDFSQVKRKNDKNKKTLKILYGSRLTPDKGIYTLLAALHMRQLDPIDYEVTATTAGAHTEEGAIIKKILEAHPKVTMVPAQATTKGMAELMAAHDVLVMPSTDIFWHEAFGMLSVEAQRAGCRVVASNAGGIPETNCGGLLLVRPDDPQALAVGIAKATQMGPMTDFARQLASAKFTVAQSVDVLLWTMQQTEEKSKIPATILPKRVLPHMEAVRSQLAMQGQQVKRTVGHLKQDTYAVLQEVGKQASGQKS